MSPIVRIFPILALLLFAAPHAAAQSNWLDKGKDMLGKFGTGSDSQPGTVTNAGASVLSTQDIAAGLKEALRVGSERVVETLGRPDGFNADPKVHIPLPENLKTVQSMLGKVGMSSLADDLELRLNRAAEAAAPEAKELFLNAISEMTLEDAQKIYSGPNDAATQYFKGKMSDPLKGAMRPVIDRSLADVGAIQAYDRMMGQYKTMPFVPDVKANLTDHALGGALDGLFFYLAQEEAAIRENPAKRTTDLLKKVFSSGG